MTLDDARATVSVYKNSFVTQTGTWLDSTHIYALAPIGHYAFKIASP